MRALFLFIFVCQILFDNYFSSHSHKINARRAHLYASYSSMINILSSYVVYFHIQILFCCTHNNFTFCSNHTNGITVNNILSRKIFFFHIFDFIPCIYYSIRFQRAYRDIQLRCFIRRVREKMSRFN